MHATMLSKKNVSVQHTSWTVDTSLRQHLASDFDKGINSLVPFRASTHSSPSNTDADLLLLLPSILPGAS